MQGPCDEGLGNLGSLEAKPRLWFRGLRVREISKCEVKKFMENKSETSSRTSLTQLV